MTAAPAAQRDFWNGAPGRRWVEHEADLEHLNRSVTAELLAAASPGPGERVLDIGCGAGATTLAFAGAVGPSGAALGIDYSEPLLALAEAHRRERGVANAMFVAGDAEVHAFAPGDRDLAVSRFGVMFFDDPVRAFRNVRAALRPGGRVALAAWAAADANPWFALPRVVATELLGAVAPSAPGAPGPMAFADAGRVTGILNAAGFSSATAARRGVVLHHPGGPAAVAALALHVGPAASVLREREGGAAEAAALEAALRDAFGRYAAPDGLRIPAEVLIYTATAP